MHDFEAVRYGVDGLPIPLYKTDHPGASEIYSSAHDLLLFGMFQLKEHLPRQFPPILSDSSIDAMHQPTMAEWDGKGYGVGWETSHKSGLSMFAHTGGMPGVQTELRIIPSERLVVVVLINSEIYDLPGVICDEILAAMIPTWKAPAETPAPHRHPPTLCSTCFRHWSVEGQSCHVRSRPARDNHDRSIVVEVHLKLADQLEALVNRPRLTETGYLRGIFCGGLALKDGVRRPYVLTLNLKLRDPKTFSGQIVAHADNRGVTETNGLYPAVAGHQRPDRIQTDAFKFAQWAELTKQD